ncbi:MAG: MarR family transcriptional regulator [Armatimonadetes bacterium]|nr:MarR family transcriptional regulator [Armatimonadota bacterium]
MSEKEPEITKSDYEALAAFRHALRKFLRFSEEGARQVGITPQQHQLLLAIKGRPGREWASIGEIAEALQVLHHGGVGLVNRCEAAGLVQRRVNPENRRQVQVTLTPKGEELLERLSRRNLGELNRLRQSLNLQFLKADGGFPLEEEPPPHDQ